MREREREREGLLARVRQIRRSADRGDPRSSAPPAGPEPTAAQDLEARVARLETQLEGLQDSVHREALRHDRRIADLEARLDPRTIAAALSRDARERGL
jgi:hypothetical protein